MLSEIYLRSPISAAYLQNLLLQWQYLNFIQEWTAKPPTDFPDLHHSLIHQLHFCDSLNFLTFPVFLKT